MAGIKERMYPETAAGGYSRIDATVEFYSRVNAILEPAMTVVDFGAGRGERLQEDTVEWRRALRAFKGKCARVIGVDVDRAVLENPGLDESHVIASAGDLPIESDSVDLIVCDVTLEHVVDPGKTAGEIARILKPGGWFCARTPNRWGYIGLGANLVPNRWHTALLRTLQPDRKPMDVFPTAYRMNTRRRLRRYFPETRFEHIVYGWFPEPAYFGNSRLMWSLVSFAARLTPEALAPIWLIFLRKR